MTTADAEKERWRLAQLYHGMAEGELEKLAEDASSLSETARRALRFELSRRGLKFELRETAAAPEATKFSKLVTIRQFVNLPDALLAKSILDSAGIESFLGDQNIIRLDWFLSNALGGVKLRVREEDAEAASALLNESWPAESDAKNTEG